MSDYKRTFAAYDLAYKYDYFVSYNMYYFF